MCAADLAQTPRVVAFDHPELSERIGFSFGDGSRYGTVKRTLSNSNVENPNAISRSRSATNIERRYPTAAKRRKSELNGLVHKGYSICTPHRSATWNWPSTWAQPRHQLYTATNSGSRQSLYRRIYDILSTRRVTRAILHSTAQPGLAAKGLFSSEYRAHRIAAGVTTGAPRSQDNKLGLKRTVVDDTQHCWSQYTLGGSTHRIAHSYT